jgi:GTPase SAR1 family protein
MTPVRPAGPPAQQLMRIKVISMGESGAGKSCLIKR